MKSLGHAVSGLALGLAIDTVARARLGYSPFAGQETLALAALIGGALLPDIDSGHSAIRRETGTDESHLGGKLIGAGLRTVGIKHRGVTHSLLALALVGLVAVAGRDFLVGVLHWQVGGLALPVALLTGYSAHLLGDMLTVAGVPLLWPWRHNFHLLPGPMHFSTNSWKEHLVTVALGVLVVYLLPGSFAWELLKQVGIGVKLPFWGN